MKIYTKTGDSGETSLFDGQRVPKTSARLKAYGDLDELNSHLGLAISLLNNQKELSNTSFSQDWMNIQNTLFNLGSYVATEKESFIKKLPPLSSEPIESLEMQIDNMQNELPELKEFILPGGSQLASQLHICRTVCRRSERHILEAQVTDSFALPTLVAQYLNRLSDYLFVASRYVNFKLNVKEPKWKK